MGNRLCLKFQACWTELIRCGNRRFLQPNIKKKEPGEIEWVTGLFWVLLLAVVLLTQLEMMSWAVASMYMEDALATSNLASALIDLEEYGRSHKIRLIHERDAYEIYKTALRQNLTLNEEWEAENVSWICSPISVEDYVIYNIEDNRVSACRIHADGSMEHWSGIKGQLRTPNNRVVETCGVYSEIQFAIKGIFGLEFTAHKGEFVDVYAKRGEEGGE